MNWGNKIAIAYSSFVIFMVILVIACVKQNDIFLVSEDYYKQEIQYQDRIDNISNTRQLENPVTVELNDKTNTLRIDLTNESAGAEGKVTFYRPSNPELDRDFPVKLSVAGVQEFPTKSLAKGLWLIKVQWQKNGKNYYTEQKVQV
jgi:hypothetical protein